MLTPRFALAVALAVTSFALTAASTLDLLCYLTVFSSCSGSALHPFGLLIFAVGATFILIATLSLQLLLERASWYCPWFGLPICSVVAVVLPKLYMFFTGSDVSLTDLSVMDAVFAGAGLVMAAVLFAVWRQRSNSTPHADARLRSSVDQPPPARAGERGR